MLLILAPGAALIVGCSNPVRTPYDAGVASLPGCDSGLHYFSGMCSGQYADELSRLACPWQPSTVVLRATDCAGYHVVGSPGPYTTFDCFYDETTGALVGGYYWTDEGGLSCAAGVGHDACPDVPYPAFCDADAGTS